MTKANFIEYVSYRLIYLVIILFCFITLYPFLYCLAYSLSDSTMAMTKTITIIPISPTFDNYITVLKNRIILNSFIISILRTVCGILYTVSITTLSAYAISKQRLPGRRFISIALLVPMYISGGLLPYYVLIYNLHLFNNFLVYILPHGFWAMHMIIMRSYFETLPASLEESAKVDGAKDITILLKIIIPLSMPIIATISMFIGVFQWNAWFDSFLFISKQKYLPLQAILQKLILENFSTDLSAQAMIADDRTTTPEAIKMSTLIVTTLPIVFIYPFFQKYYIKGIMIGAVKA